MILQLHKLVDCQPLPCSCLFEAQKPFGPFLEALAGSSDFTAPPPAVLSATGIASPPKTFNPDPEPGEYDDEDDYRQGHYLPQSAVKACFNITPPATFNPNSGAGEYADEDNFR